MLMLLLLLVMMMMIATFYVTVPTHTFSNFSGYAAKRLNLLVRILLYHCSKIIARIVRGKKCGHI